MTDIDYSFKIEGKLARHKKVHEKISELCKTAKEYGLKIPEDLNVELVVNFKINSVRVAGDACYRWIQKQMTIRLHDKALEHYGDEFINRTVVHEFAHIIVFCNFPKAKAHGREFKMLMRVFGSEGTRCHSYDLRSLVPHKVRKTAQRFEYKCQCSRHNLSKIRHNRILNGSIYTCKNCRTDLVKA